MDAERRLVIFGPGLPLDAHGILFATCHEIAGGLISPAPGMEQYVSITCEQQTQSWTVREPVSMWWHCRWTDTVVHERSCQFMADSTGLHTGMFVN